MLPIRTILVATDFSPMSEHAFRFAGALARDYGARLVLLHVIRPSVAVYAETAVLLAEGDVEAARQTLHAMSCPPIEVDYRLVEGEPGPAIARLAQDVDCDLVVMGTHGRSGLMRMLLGSTAEYVLRHAPCPVMTIKADVPVPVPEPEAALAQEAR